MSAARVALVLAQAICAQIVTTPPKNNASSTAGKYHIQERWIFRIAPFIFALQQPFIWSCAFLEVLSLLPLYSSTYPLPTQLRSLLPAAPSANHRITPLFFLGTSAILLDSYIRYACFSTLGKLFTFTLTIQKDHFLVTTGPYSIVRHRAYTGSLLLVFGMRIAHVAAGSALVELGIVKNVGGGGWGGLGVAVVWAAWWAWGVACATRRCIAEDEEMRRMFGKEWEDYAKRVPWWYVPGLI